jgi:hypothetical protein
MQRFILTAAIATGVALPAIAQDLVVYDENDPNTYLTVDQVRVIDPEFTDAQFEDIDTDNSGTLDSGEIATARESALFPLASDDGSQ